MYTVLVVQPVLKQEGSAYTLVSVKEQRKFHAIEQLIGKDVSKMDVPAHLGEQPSMHQALPGH
jgi:hypothetical protein